MNKATSILLTFFTMLATTTVVLLYSDGWRINNGSLTENGKDNQSIIVKTGMLAVRSSPDAAQILIDDEIITATDSTISSLAPGKHKLEIKKDGYEVWQKEVNIYPEVVTDITAILVLKSPKLESLTNSDVSAFNISTNGNKIAYLTQNHTKPGIWILPLTGSTLNLFKTDSQVLIEDNIYARPSLGENIWWSPDDKEILVQLNENGYLLYETPDIKSANLNPINIIKKEDVFDRWKNEWQKDFLNNEIKTFATIKASNEIINQALLSNYSDWSPDNDKFFFIKPNVENQDISDLYVYNLDNPLPIDEKRLTKAMEITNPDDTFIYWYTDSYHLVILERVPDTNQYTVSLLRIDGSNKTPIYTGILASPKAFSTPGGNQIIVMASLKEGSAENLYGISIH